MQLIESPEWWHLFTAIRQCWRLRNSHGNYCKYHKKYYFICFKLVVSHCHHAKIGTQLPCIFPPIFVSILHHTDLCMRVLTSSVRSRNGNITFWQSYQTSAATAVFTSVRTQCTAKLDSFNLWNLYCVKSSKLMTPLKKAIRHTTVIRICLWPFKARQLAKCSRAQIELWKILITFYGETLWFLLMLRIGKKVRKNRNDIFIVLPTLKGKCELNKDFNCVSLRKPVYFNQLT